MINNLQALRALAAIGVVVFHVGLLPATSLPFTIGAAGVDLFFVLSGFIIAYSASHDARQFLARRLIRILPAYWIATAIAALFVLQAMSPPETLYWLVQSLFYLPGPGGRPVLIFVAWTLVYELAFYLLYWLALRAGTRRAPVVAIAMLLVLGLVPMPGLPGPWPLLLEFVLGVCVNLAIDNLSRPVGKRVGLWVAGAGLLALPLLAQLTDYNPDDYQSVERVLVWGLPAACIVLGAILAEREGLAIRNRAILLLGAASYAIYLLHPVAVGQLLQLPSQSPPTSWLACTAATAAIVGVSVLFHRFVEVRMLRWMRQIISRAE